VQPSTIVYQQDPAPGNRIDKGNTVTIFVSTGKPKVVVPEVHGKSSVDAVQALADAGLKSKLMTVPSDQPAGTVVAQDPKAGSKVVVGTLVHVNVAKGPTQVGVPLVVGELFDQAAGQLQAQGFAVARKDVDSSQPKGTVISQSPAGGVAAPTGSTVTLSVSLGPPATPVPDVTSLDASAATATLQAAGFTAKVVTQPTTDPGQDGIVLSQSPVGGTDAKAGSTVTITVGSLGP
jgi:serine/threonine-protein kinase